MTIRFNQLRTSRSPPPQKCAPGGDNGNFIMFARATSGDKPNNRRFSPCSIDSMNLILEAKAIGDRGCFVGEELGCFPSSG